MKVIVCVKQIIDPTTVELDPETGVVNEGRLLYLTNPADLCAMEEAVRLKERWKGVEVVAVSVGPPEVEETLRRCLALGADRAIRIWDGLLREAGGYALALVLAEAIRQERAELVLCGTASADQGGACIGPFIAELLELPQVCGITYLELFPNQGRAIVHRKLERGEREIVECPLPALFTVEANLNQPRYPALPVYMEALIASIPVIDLKELGISPGVLHRLKMPKVVAVTPPRPRPRRLFTPDSSLPAFERIGAILSAGLPRRERQLVTGALEQVTERIVQFLQDNGMLPRTPA